MMTEVVRLVQEGRRSRDCATPQTLQYWAVSPHRPTGASLSLTQGTLWRLEASALLELQERVLPVGGGREVRFTQVEGDFKVRFIARTRTVHQPGHQKQR